MAGILTSRRSPSISLLLLLALLASFQAASAALNQDGALLLAFKSSLLADPLGSLAGWGASAADATPCGWNGIVCNSDQRVAGVILPNEQLVGPVSRDLAQLEHLRHLDLSGNALNGTVPADLLLRAPELRVLSLAGNGITGALPDQPFSSGSGSSSLRALNLAGNALSGPIPGNLLASLRNLTAVSLASNFFSGALPGGGLPPALQVFDASSNLLNGTLPADLGGPALRYLNLSSNRLAGTIPSAVAPRLPGNVSIDLSNNNLTGAIPAVPPFSAQRAAAFAGNAGLCGRPLDTLCSDAASVMPFPNGTATTKSPPAIAAIPNDPTDGGGAAASSGGQGGSRMKLATILAIATGDVAGIAVVFVVFFYVYQARKRRQERAAAAAVVFKKAEPEESPDVGRSLSCCPRKKAGDESDSTEEEEVTDTSASPSLAAAKEEAAKKERSVLVTVDGEQLELETLLKASAYILGASGEHSIVYKAVLAGGSGGALAVRRIDGAGLAAKKMRFGELEAQMRGIARLRHRNILRLRGFCWGPDELLLIHDLAANGSLQMLDVAGKKLGWGARLRVARGVARGLAYLHDGKCVHGSVRPSNILLDAHMEPLLADLGVHRLLVRPAGPKRSARSLPDAGPSAEVDAAARYRAPEAAAAAAGKKASAKWDVYAFGVLLLELAAGRALSAVELCQWSSAAAGAGEQQKGMLVLADPALRGEMEGREEALASCLRLGFSCCAMPPGKRPAIKDALQAIDRIPSPSTSAPS